MGRRRRRWPNIEPALRQRLVSLLSQTYYVLTHLLSSFLRCALGEYLYIKGGSKKITYSYDLNLYNSGSKGWGQLDKGWPPPPSAHIYYCQILSKRNEIHKNCTCPYNYKQKNRALHTGTALSNFFLAEQYTSRCPRVPINIKLYHTLFQCWFNDASIEPALRQRLVSLLSQTYYILTHLL